MICLAVYVSVMLLVAFAFRRKSLDFQILAEGMTLAASMLILSTPIYQNPFVKPASFSLTLIFLSIPILGSGEEIEMPISKSFVISSTTLFPIAEEILFRWCLLKEFGILTSAIVFSLAHLTNVFSKIEKFSVEPLIARFILGMVLGEMVVQSGSIIPSIVFHSAVNLLAVVKSDM